MRQSQGADVPSPEYVAALLAFYEDRLDEALAQLEAMKDRLPWFHEAPLLRGDILQARATRRWNQGDREGALADFEAGRRAYTAAAATGESVPEVHRALAMLEYTVMVMELYSKGDVMPPFTRGLEAVARALQADPDFGLARVLEAYFYNRLAEYRMSRGLDVEEPLQKALSAARTAMRLVPEPPRARMEQVQSLWRRARSLQARSLDPHEPLQQAVELLGTIPPKEQDYEFHATRGLVFKIWADYEDEKGEDSLPHRGEAIASYREAIRLDERLPDAWINLGIAYLTRATHPRATTPLEDLKQAQAALDTSRKLNPGNYVPYFLGGTLHLELAQRRRSQGEDARPDLTTALEFFEGGIRINARIAQLHNGRSAVLFEQAREAWDHGGDPFPLLEQAGQAARQAIEVAPQQGFGHHNVGETQAERATLPRALRGGPAPRAPGGRGGLPEGQRAPPGRRLLPGQPGPSPCAASGLRAGARAGTAEEPRTGRGGPATGLRARPQGAPGLARPGGGAWTAGPLAGSPAAGALRGLRGGRPRLREDARAGTPAPGLPHRLRPLLPRVGRLAAGDGTRAALRPEAWPRPGGRGAGRAPPLGGCAAAAREPA